MRCESKDEIWDRQCDREAHPEDLHWSESPGDTVTWGSKDLVRAHLRERDGED